MLQRLALLAALLAAPVGASAALEPLGSWHVLIHYRDARSADPEAWRWEDRVWVFVRDGDRLLWTDYELVSFMDTRGRFEALRTPLARRLVGAWEPSESQQREIERGLFVNPRGARTLALWRADEGWKTRRSAERPGAVLGFELAGSIAFEEDHAVFHLEESFLDPDALVSSAPGDSGITTVFRTTVSKGPGRPTSGRYERADGRRGRFRLTPTRLRRRLTPHAGVGPGVIRLQPDAYAEWERFWAALVRPWRYFAKRTVSISSTPPGATLDLAYLRDGARLMFEQSHAPVAVELPTRLVARRSDTLSIDAYAPGYESLQINVEVHSDTETVAIDLPPLANRLLGAGFRELAGRALLTLLTSAELGLRSREGETGLELVLPRTGLAKEAEAALGSWRGETIGGFRALQLGPDLLLRIRFGVGSSPTWRVRTGFDPARELHRTTLEFEDLDRARDRATRVRTALASAQPAAVTGCALVFDEALRRGLPQAALARALDPLDDFSNAFLREALRRLGLLSKEGRVQLLDGTRLRTTEPLELEVALHQAHQVIGFLALLRHVAGALAVDEEAALNGLMAPETKAGAFSDALRSAKGEEAVCRAG